MKYKHGHCITGKHTPEFDCWQSIKARCNRKSHTQYEDYGGRGIKICDEWNNSYIAFFEHVGPRTSPLHSLDRINNNDGYKPGNVRWATRSEQQKNRRYTKEREVEAIRNKLAKYEAKFGPLEE